MLERLENLSWKKKVALGVGVGYGIWWGTAALSMSWSCKSIFWAAWTRRETGGTGEGGEGSGTDWLGMYELLLPWKLHEVAGACDVLNLLGGFWR